MKCILSATILILALPVFSSQPFEEGKASPSAYSKVVEAKDSSDACIPWGYSVGRFFWTGLHALIHSQNNTTNAQLGKPSQGDDLVTLRTLNPVLAVDNIYTARNVPKEEDTFAAKYLPKVLGFLRDHLTLIRE